MPAMLEAAICVKEGMGSIKNPFKEDKSALSSELEAELVLADLGD